MLAFVAVFFVTIQYAQAEIFSIQGKNTDMGIFIFIENEDNIMKIYTESGDAEYFDSKVKFYKSGGFSIKSSEIAIWGHPISSSQYDLLILTSEGKTKLTASTNEIHDVISSEGTLQIIEPKSSIGADITKYDIPTNPRDQEREPKIIVYLDSVSHIFVNDEYAPNIKVENQDFEKIAAVVNLEITRDGHTIKSISDSVSNGVWNPIINVLDDYYTPGFCYTITVTAASGNHTATAQDDFSVVSTAKYWDKDADPIDADSKCNK